MVQVEKLQGINYEWFKRKNGSNGLMVTYNIILSLCLKNTNSKNAGSMTTLSHHSLSKDAATNETVSYEWGVAHLALLQQEHLAFHSAQIQRFSYNSYRGSIWYSSRGYLGNLKILSDDYRRWGYSNDVLKVEMRNNATVISTATTTVCKTQVLGFSILSQLLVVQLVLLLYTIIPSIWYYPCKASLLQCSCYIHFQCVILYWSHSSNKCCYTRYCFRSLISQHYEPTNRFTNRLNDGGRHIIENPQAADLSVGLTNSIIPQRGVGAVTYSRATIATLNRTTSESFVNVFLVRLVFKEREGVRNLTPYSQDVNFWNKFSLTVSGTKVAYTDGSLIGQTIISDAATAVHYVSNGTWPVIIWNTYLFSVSVKNCWVNYVPASICSKYSISKLWPHKLIDDWYCWCWFCSRWSEMVGIVALLNLYQH